MGDHFRKRTYTVASLVRDLFALVPSLRRLVSGKESESLDRAFVERIMLAVTQVNDCRYCAHAHAAAAIRAGVTRLEIEAVMRGDFQSAPRRERYALRFARHYAEKGGRPDPQAVMELTKVYGGVTAEKIKAYIRMITLGNLLGNTFDALLSRLRGQPSQDGSLVSELMVLGSALLLGPLMMLVAAPLIFISRPFS